MLNVILIISSVIFFQSADASPFHKNEIVLSEEFLSPTWENYDCHSSSIVQIENGELLAFWKGGVGKGKSNIDIKSKVGIWQARFDGRAWSLPEEVHFEEDGIVWNPVATRLPSGEILLFYRVGDSPRDSAAFLKRSVDGGSHWSEPEFLPAGINGPTKNKPLILEDGTLLCPSSMQAGSPGGVYQVTAAWIDISKDGGRTWSKSGPLVIPGQPFGAVEPVLCHDGEGNLRLLCRDRAHRIGGVNGAIWTSVSYDMGMTWSQLEKTALPNPDSAIDVVDMGRGNLVLFYNRSSVERFPLSIAVSKDGGKTWEKGCDLEEKTGEFPAAIYAEDGAIHITYAYEIETKQRRIKHTVIDPAKLFQSFDN